MATFAKEPDIGVQAPCLAGDVISPREREIVLLVALGYRNAEVATELEISSATVRAYLHNSFRKTGVQNRHELTKYALRIGLV